MSALSIRVQQLRAAPIRAPGMDSNQAKDGECKWIEYDLQTFSDFESEINPLQSGRYESFVEDNLVRVRNAWLSGRSRGLQLSAQTRERWMSWIDWYNSLEKPSWTPPPATIGFIWQILYPVIFVSFGFVFLNAIRGNIPRIVALPFAINLVANLIFTPLQFGLRSLFLAAADILIVWATILWSAIAIWPHHKWVSLSQIPYFVWVSIATVLQLAITFWNWSK
jgi:benzodiazapine receptor